MSSTLRELLFYLESSLQLKRSVMVKFREETHTYKGYLREVQELESHIELVRTLYERSLLLHESKESVND